MAPQTFWDGEFYKIKNISDCKFLYLVVKPNTLPYGGEAYG